MEFVSKVNDLLIMEDDINYIVKETVEVDGEGYLVLESAEINLVDEFDGKKRKTVVVKEIVTEDEEYYLEGVTDAKLLKKIEEIVYNK